MNFLLSLNKKYVLLITILFVGILVLFLFYKYFFSFQNHIKKNNFKVSNVDITEPRFAINNSSQKILVKAKEGNFVDKNKILLKKNVEFKSNDFSIKTDNVIFDRKKQTAQSNNKSIFKSEKTTISSDGFNIYDNGNIINFYGKSVITIK